MATASEAPFGASRTTSRVSIRGIVLITMLSLGIITVGASIAQVILNSRVDRIMLSVRAEVESIRAMGEVRVHLYRYSRERLLLMETGLPHHADALREAEEGTRHWLSVAGNNLDGVESQVLFADAQDLVDDYFAETKAPAPPGLSPAARVALASMAFDAALEAADAFLDESEASAEVKRRHIVDSSLAITHISVIVIAVLPLTILLLLIAARHGIFLPFQRQREALSAYASGDLDVRAPESGPIELEEMGRSFNRLADTLDQQRQSRSDFFLSVAHDLRNPLSALKATVDLAERRAKVGPPTEEQLRKEQRRLRTQVERLNRMVGDLVEIGKIEGGHFSLELAVHDLVETCRETASLFEDASDLHPIVVEVPARPVLVCCDETRIGQVLNNFVSNAIKYSPQGGEVKVSLRSEGDEAVIEVEDHGVGIPEESQAKIFEPFLRLRHDKIPGVGLGLSVAKRLVESQGGRIEVESEAGVGSTFRALLPLAPRD